LIITRRSVTANSEVRQVTSGDTKPSAAMAAVTRQTRRTVAGARSLWRMIIVAAKITKAAKPTALPKMTGCSLVRNTTRSCGARWRST